MRNIRYPTQTDPRTALLRKRLVTVLGAHLLLGEVRVLVAEVLGVEGQGLAVELALDLVDDVVEGVAVDEGGFRGGVAVHVEVEEQAGFAAEVLGELAQGVDLGSEVRGEGYYVEKSGLVNRRFRFRLRVSMR